MGKHLKILTAKYLQEYSDKVNVEWLEVFNNLRLRDKYASEDFKYKVMVSAAYSSNIEGNTIDSATYIKNKRMKIKGREDQMNEIDDLASAYNFAIKNKLTKTNFLKSHYLSSSTILSNQSERGRVRTRKMFIIDESGRIEYVAASEHIVKKEFNKLFSDIQELLKRDLHYKEVFYYASLIHMKFEQIHPFMDGNGRTGRLLEKWFLSQKIGKNAWGIESEKYYYKNINDYYKNLQLGIEYSEVNMDKCLPFLLMLPSSLK